MLKKVIQLFRRKRSHRQFKDYYVEWLTTLKNTHLPLLRHSISESSPTLLSTHVNTLLTHFLSYYHALDLAAASNGVAPFLYPDWRNPIEIPFLFLGDFHPYLFTNLLRSFLDDSEEDEDEKGEEDHDPKGNLGRAGWEISMAWKNPSKMLMTRIDQIGCGLRLMVPALVSRSRNSQTHFVEQVAGNYVITFEGKKEEEVVREAGNAEMDEMLSVFIDANRLRRSVLLEIVGATSVYQAAMFLEGLAQFFVGFTDSELNAAFKRCEMVPLDSQSWLQI